MPGALVSTKDMTHEKEMRLFKYTGSFPEKTDSSLRKGDERLISAERFEHVGEKTLYVKRETEEFKGSKSDEEAKAFDRA